MMKTEPAGMTLCTLNPSSSELRPFLPFPHLPPALVLSPSLPQPFRYLLFLPSSPSPALFPCPSLTLLHRPFQFYLLPHLRLSVTFPSLISLSRPTLLLFSTFPLLPLPSSPFLVVSPSPSLPFRYLPSLHLPFPS